MRLPALAILAVGLAGCGGDGSTNDGGSDGGNADLRMNAGDMAHDAGPPDLFQPPRDSGPSDDLVYAPAPHTPNLKFSPNDGTIIAKPGLVTVTFQGYIYEPDVQKFGDFIVASAWLPTVGAAYGVGAGVHVKKVVLQMNSPNSIDDNGIQTIINGAIAGNALPAPGTSTIYAIYFPPNVTIMGAGSAGELCTSGAFGYHYFGNYNGAKYAYSVIADCAMTTAQVMGVSAHELIEAATDPFLSSWSVQVASSDPWSLYQNSEVADVCSGLGYAMEGGYVLPRVWSNKAAMNDDNPCVPAAPGPYYNVSASPAMIPKIAPGSSATFVLTGWSQSPVPDWTLSFLKAPGSQFDATPMLDTMMTNNGKVAMLTLTVPANTPSGKIGGTAIVSGIPSGRFWPVAVQAQ
jgi:hypothetical protein